jgi:hypothetical protein
VPRIAVTGRTLLRWCCCACRDGRLLSSAQRWMQILSSQTFDCALLASKGCMCQTYAVEDEQWIGRDRHCDYSSRHSSIFTAFSSSASPHVSSTSSAEPIIMSAKGKKGSQQKLAFGVVKSGTTATERRTRSAGKLSLVSPPSKDNKVRYMTECSNAPLHASFR